MTLEIVRDAITNIRSSENIWPASEQALTRLEADDTPTLWKPILKRLTAPSTECIRPVVWAITFSAHRVTLAEAFSSEGHEADLERLKSCVTALERFFGPIAKDAVEDKAGHAERMMHLAAMRATLDFNLRISRTAFPYFATLSRKKDTIAAFHFYMVEELSVIVGTPLHEFVGSVTDVLFQTDGCSKGRVRGNHTDERDRRIEAGQDPQPSLSSDPHYSPQNLPRMVLTTK